MLEYLQNVDWISFAAGVVSLIPLLVWAIFRKRPVETEVKIVHIPYTYRDFQRDVRSNLPIDSVIRKCGGSLPYRYR